MDPILSILAAWFAASVVTAIGYALGAAVGYRRGLEEGCGVAPGRVIQLDDHPVLPRTPVTRGR